MAKIMLVEDDNNLREIYEARLLAEGYEIVSAEDGEQALAMAVKEKPDLIISDVMMPKISGFDMLDILRSTPETKHTKVIMMTALSQAEDKARADKLGADKYLVKSQVTLEDVAKVAQEVLQDGDTVPAASTQPTTDTPASTPNSAPATNLPTTNPSPTAPAQIATQQDDSAAIMAAATVSTDDNAQSVAGASTTIDEQITNFVQNIPGSTQATMSADATNAAADTAASMANTVNDLLQKPADTQSDVATNTSTSPLASNQIAGKKVIAPINDLSANSGPDLEALLAKEMGEIPTDLPTTPLPPTTDTNIDTTTPVQSNESPVDVPLPGIIQAPGDPNDPSNIAL